MELRNKLIQIARTIVFEKPLATNPFPNMPTWQAGYNPENDEFYIVDNGMIELETGDPEHFIDYFVDIAIYDLNVHFENDDEAIENEILSAEV